MANLGFLRLGRQLPRGCTNLLFCEIFAKTCMKMKELGPRGGSVRPLGSTTVRGSCSCRFHQKEYLTVTLGFFRWRIYLMKIYVFWIYTHLGTFGKLAFGSKHKWFIVAELYEYPDSTMVSVHKTSWPEVRSRLFNINNIFVRKWLCW